MNPELAAAAQRAMHDPQIESAKGYCSRFVRQIAEQIYGKRFRSMFGATAIATCSAFKSAGYSVPANSHLENGDILFKTSAGRYGHVGVFVSGEGVAENSSTRIGRIEGAKGFRSLEEFGRFNVIVRLPRPGENLRPPPEQRN
jgi:hypothetical protein